MRNMSFTLTTRQLLDGSKTVTRRLGWRFLKPGDRVQAVEKSRGLKKGERVKRLCVIEIVGVQREPLHRIKITPRDVAREGFPDLTADAFVAMFCAHMGCKPDTEVTRIEFRRVDS